MPSSTARLMASTASSSSCGPQAAAQPLPPMAQLPKPIGVISIPVLPNSRFSKAVSSISGCRLQIFPDAWNLKRHRDKRRGIVGGAGEHLLGPLERHPALLGLDHGPHKTYVPDHRDARYLLAR